MKANLTKLLLCLFLVLLKGVVKADNSFTVFQKDSIVQQRVPPSNFIGPKYKNVTVYTVDNTPDPKEGSSNGFVSDPNNYISVSEEYKINTILWELEENSTAQVAVVI